MSNPNAYIPSVKTPIFPQRFTLTASEYRIVDLIECVRIFVSSMIELGTGAGDISIALGPTSEFFDLAPGDLIKCSPVGQIRLRNNTATSKSFQLIFTNDPNFAVENYSSRGL